jgi:hypothetical protein
MAREIVVFSPEDSVLSVASLAAVIRAISGPERVITEISNPRAVLQTALVRGANYVIADHSRYTEAFAQVARRVHIPNLAVITMAVTGRERQKIFDSTRAPVFELGLLGENCADRHRFERFLDRE